MFTEVINKVIASQKATRRYHCLSSFIALVFALTMYPTQAHAQIIDDLDANIPFQFCVGNTKLPAGEYRIQVVDNSDLTVMEISRVDGSASALFQVQDAETSNEPAQSELIFNKYGNRYFLAKLFDEGNPSGSQLAESGYEKKISQGNAQAEEHVSAHRMQKEK
jgi:hypothetical protein